MTEVRHKKVVLISGMSGAGKSTAARILEDMGYHIIDNFPVQLISILVDMIEATTDSRYDYVALSTCALDFPEFLRGLCAETLDVQVLFLDANDSTLLHRYKSTRRLHPLLLSNTCNTLDEAIAMERQMFTKNQSDTFVNVDTSFMTDKEFREMLENWFAKRRKSVFSISFESFGYKYGVPMDADLVLDVRFLPNPFWVVALRPHNGNEKCVYDYVMEKPETKEFLDKLLTFLDYAFAQYKKEGKKHFTVGIGCTGGQHRSVTITNFLYDYYKAEYEVFKSHRDEKEWIKE